MSNVNICDQCAERVHERGPRWHLEYDGQTYSMGSPAVYPADFCSLECLTAWATSHTPRLCDAGVGTICAGTTRLCPKHNPVSAA